MNYTLAFDVYGTLINTSGVLVSLEKMIGNKASLINETWRNKQLEYSFRRATMGSYVDFSVCTQQALNFACLQHQVELSESQKQSLMHEYTILPAFDDVIEGLTKITQQEHKIYAFSNGSKDAVIKLLKNANIFDIFDGVVSVEDKRIFKPSPIVYQHFNNETHSQKENTWLISSNPFDVTGAKHFGFQSAWVQRTEKSIFDPWEIQPNIIVNGITDLADKL